jgi:hypothetical protein
MCPATSRQSPRKLPKLRRPRHEALQITSSPHFMWSLFAGLAGATGLGFMRRRQTCVLLCAETPAALSSDTTDLARYRLCSLEHLTDVVHDDERTAAVVWTEKAAPAGAANVCLYEHATSFAHLFPVCIFALTCIFFVVFATHMHPPLRTKPQGLEYTPYKELVTI